MVHFSRLLLKVQKCPYLFTTCQVDALLSSADASCLFGELKINAILSEYKMEYRNPPSRCRALCKKEEKWETEKLETGYVSARRGQKGNSWKEVSNCGNIKGPYFKGNILQRWNILENSFYSFPWKLYNRRYTEELLFKKIILL